MINMKPLHNIGIKLMIVEAKGKYQRKFIILSILCWRKNFYLLMIYGLLILKILGIL